MNKHIELVEKWLADNESVSKRKLVANANAAYDITNATYDTTYAAYAAACAANAASDDPYAAYAATEAAYWVAKYHEVPIGEDTRPKDRIKQGISPHCVIVDINSEDL